MDLLIVESLEAELVEWLRLRLTVRLAPELAQNPRELLRAVADARSIIVPAGVAIDERFLRHAPRLRAVGRIAGGFENIDAAACAAAGVDVVRSTGGSARAEAEFMVGALLSMMRRIPVRTRDGARVGRELGAAAVGLVGLVPAARTVAGLLTSFGSTLYGFDPTVHGGDSVWMRWDVQPLGLRELFERCDAVCVQLGYFSRYRALIGDRVLPFCKPNQVLVSIGPSALFDAAALGDVLTSGRLAAAWLDGVEPGLLQPGQPLSGLDNLQTTPRIAGITAESRRRCAWAVAKRIDRLLDDEGLAGSADRFRTTAPAPPPDDPSDPEAGSRWL